MDMESRLLYSIAIAAHSFTALQPLRTNDDYDSFSLLCVYDVCVLNGCDAN